MNSNRSIQIDPDINFLEAMADSNYFNHSNFYDINEFNDHFTETPNDLFFLSLNIRSFNANIDEFRVFISHLNVTPKVLVVTETWFSHDTCQNLPGYNSFHSTRLSGRGGGVSVYVKENILCKSLPELCVCNNTIESCSLELNFKNEKISLIGVYRPHSDSEENFTNTLCEMLESTNLRQTCVLLGDLNINLLNDSPETEVFVNSVQSLGFFNLIVKPTRFCPSNNSAPSLLDHIWLNSTRYCKSGIFSIDISDHCPVFLKFFVENETPPEQKIKITFRNKSCRNRESFKRAVSQFRWDSIFSNDLNEMVENFTKTLNDLYCTYFPIMSKFVSQKRLDKPWMSSRIFQLIKDKSHYFKSHKIGLINSDENRRYRNFVNGEIRYAKRNYYERRFENCKNDIKKTWSIIHEIIGHSKNYATRRKLEGLIHNGVLNSSSVEMAQIFSNFFGNIAQNIDNAIPISNEDPVSYVCDNNLSSIFLTPVDIIECTKQINNLKNTSVGFHSISVRMLKEVKDYVAPIISSMINIAFSSGSFPNCLKTAYITPIHKKGDRNIATNFRPISVLPLLSKIFERCFEARLSNFLTNFDIISKNQFGFMKGLTTEHAILKFTESAYSALNAREHVIAVFIDFQKAFDLVSHDILIRKLEAYGIRGNASKLVRSFISDRINYVKVNGEVSSGKVQTIGLPQGSCISPTLFKIFINDLPNFSNICETFLFADDTTFIFKNKSYENLISTCNSQLELFDSWCQCNRLSINVSKSNALLISNRISPSENPQIFLCNQLIEFKDQVSFLGVVVDRNLKFSSHISYSCNKMSKSIGIFYKLKNYIDTKSLIKLYYTFIYPYMIYCNVIWGGTNQTHLNRMFVLQKRVIRVIHGLNSRAHTEELFFDSKILKLKDLNFYFLGQHVYKNFDSFTSDHVTGYMTRQNSDLRPMYQRLSLTQKSIYYAAPSAWNCIPRNIRCLDKIEEFKIELKNFCVNKYRSN